MKRPEQQQQRPLSGGRLLLFLIAASDHLDELFDVHAALRVGGHLGKDLLALLWGELLAPGGEGVLEAVLFAEALAFVVHVEGASNHVLVVRSLGAIAEDGQESGEVDGALWVCWLVGWVGWLGLVLFCFV